MFRPVRIVRFFPGPRCHRRSSMVVKEPHLFSSRTCKRMCGGRTLTVRQVVGQDKANFRSPLAVLASVCLHIVFNTSQRHYRGTLKVVASAAPSAIHLITNDKLWHRRNVHSAVSTLQQVFLRFTAIGVRDILRMLNWLPILPLWQAIKETISTSRRGGPEAAERASPVARRPLSGRSRSPFARLVATPIGSTMDRRQQAAGKEKEAAGSTREAGARRWWHPSQRMVAAGSETPPAGFARGGSSSRRG